MLANIECAKQKIRLIIAGSQVPEDPCHAENTLEWLLHLETDAGETLQPAAFDRIQEAIDPARACVENVLRALAHSETPPGVQYIARLSELNASLHDGRLIGVTAS